jgi:dihydrofolate synthase/folylpolyglutamate synthase
VVHVGGSKGKGSVAALIGAGLRCAGLRVGRYASPHVERMNERVEIDGADVKDGVLAEALECTLRAREDALAAGTAGREATWFDLVTASAFRIFGRERVDWIVAEVGLGGRLDSTNVLDGEVCVVTNVELEHTAVLGDTRAKIAGEKAGILKPGCALVTGLPEGDEAGDVIDERARALEITVCRPLRPADDAATIEERNLALAAAVLDELGGRGATGLDGKRLDAARLDRHALHGARLPGRLERIRARGVPVVLDGAHTPNSVRDVLRDLTGAPDLPGSPVVVLGIAREKDLPGVLKTLVGGVDRVLCTSVGGALHMTPEEMAGAARDVGLAAETAVNPRVALDRALELAAGGRWVLVLGSLYLAGALRPLLLRPSLD